MTRKSVARLVVLTAVLLPHAVVAQTGESLESGVTAADIAAGFADPTRWLTFSGDYTRPAAQPAETNHAAERAQA